MFISWAAVQPDIDRLRSEIRDIAPPVGGGDARAWLYLGIAAIVIAVVAAILYLARRRRFAAGDAPGAVMTPHEAALARLDELDFAVDAKEAYSELAAIARDYIHARFGIAGPDAPTAEFLADLFGRGLLDGSQREVLRTLLANCDLVKFAGRRPSGLETQEDARRCRVFIERSRLEIVSTTGSTLFGRE